ncbi:right-handed parallel beta-helix repeat-containing protein [Paenibacillus illinoisensis]|uniref:right-handed parallel beta-helix repeat-containing protein n=1 Tax=Paenibacillus illinoisensis TaxID=59845 RepID=UPI003CEC701E
MSLALVLTVPLFWVNADKVSAASSTYYVDSENGNDTSDGLSPTTPWKSLDNVNATIFLPGDQILLKAGSIWTGEQLSPKGSGTSSDPIVINTYGTGDKPRLDGEGAFDSTVYLYNQEYWEINNIEVTNQTSIGDFRGIYVTGADYGTISHIYLKGVHVHDVTGEVNWIGGDVEDSTGPINFGSGWDASKRTGGIVFDVTTNVADDVAPTVKTKFDDIIIEDSVIENTSFGGIIFKQYAGNNAKPVNWGTRSSATDTKFYPHSNIIIRNNYVDQSNSDYGCNGIYVTGVQNVLVENNLVVGAGTVGIEAYFADSVIIQKNEVRDTEKKAGGSDHSGIDPDKATTNITVQYNYIHDNGDGILLCQFSFGSANIRYNVIESNSRHNIYLHADARAKINIYNNVIYSDKSQSLIYGYGKYLNAEYNIKNNIFYSTVPNAVLTTGGNILYDHNTYYGTGINVPTQDTNAKTTDPMLVNPGSGVAGTKLTGPNLSSLEGYKLLPGSPSINSGISYTTIKPDADFYGNPLYNKAADRGVHEY